MAKKTDQILLGSQTPTFQRIGDYNPKRGQVCSALFASYGVNFLPSQKTELELYCSRTRDGLPTARTIALSRPRQNGKTFVASFYALWCAFVEGKNVLFTFHKANRAREAFKEALVFLDKAPDFTSQLKAHGGIYRAQGSEGIYLKSGASILYTTRTNSGARGGSVQLLIFDEAQETTDDQFEAILPTLSASQGRGQSIHVGTPPSAATQGTVFRRMHDLAHSSQEIDSWWLEWAAEEWDETTNGDPARWQATNPLLGHRINPASVRAEFETMNPQGFARERLGWWSPTGTLETEKVFTEEDWAAVETKQRAASGEEKIWLGVKFSLDGKRVTVAVARAGDPVTLEVIKNASTHRGTKWLTRWILENRKQIQKLAIDGKRGEPVLNQLAEARFPKTRIKKATSQDMAKAVAQLVEAVANKDIQIYAQPDLAAAATGCPKRRIGLDGYGFADTVDFDSTLPEAVALAFWTRQIQPARKARISF